MNNKHKQTDNTISRNKERDCIEQQVQAFLEAGGKIEVLSSPFDGKRDPKCRLGDEVSFFK